MQAFLYKFFHAKTNDRSEEGIVNIPTDDTKWPLRWKTIFYKEYLRAPKILLPIVHKESQLSKLLERRNSNINNIHKQKIKIDLVAHILKSAYGFISSSSQRRAVPSGGARFPLELYLVVWGEIEGLKPGNYHYGVKKHNLDVINSAAVIKDSIFKYTSDEWVKDAHGAILIAAVFERSTNKYGSRGYRYTLLEAGHVGQNICLSGAELGISVRPIGAINEDVFEDTLFLCGDEEKIIYGLIF